VNGALVAAVTAFVDVDLTAWPGLPVSVALTDLADLLDFDADHPHLGSAGAPSRSRSWLAAASSAYSGGLRLWLDDDEERVVAFEGLGPVDASDEPRLAPDLTVPDGRRQVAFGPAGVPGVESVYAGRGLAVQVYPATGALLGVVGFAPTTIADYRSRIRPYDEPDHPLLLGGPR
jgi:hypothetical protein